MNQASKRLPILDEPGTGPGPGFPARLLRAMAPSTRMKRLTYLGVILWVASFWNAAFLVGAFPLLLVGFVYYGAKLASLLRARLFWRVRNRILASFVFIGVVPICVVALIGVILVWFLIGAMGTLFTERQFEATLNRLDRIALRVQLELDDRELNPPTLPAGRSPTPDPSRRLLDAGPGLHEAVGRAMRENADLPDLSVGIYEKKADRYPLAAPSDSARGVPELPGWAARSHFAGLVVDDSTGFFRAISDIRLGERRLFVMASVPLSQAYEHAFWTRSGVYIYPYTTEGFRHGRHGMRVSRLRVLKDPFTALDLISHQEARRTDASLKIGAMLLPWMSLSRFTEWTLGPGGADSNPLVIRMSIDPIRIFRHSLSGGYEMADTLLTTLIVLCGILACVEVASLAIGAVISKRITYAVHNLSLGTQAIRAGRLDFRVEEHHRDQLGELAASFNDMAESIQGLLKEVGEKERIETELQMAREVQAQFFPKTIPRVGRLALAGTCIPARTVSGDGYDFLMHGDELLDIVVTDISGKGMSAALLTASLQSALRLQVSIGTVEPGRDRLSRLVGHLNRHLYMSTAPERFATLFIGSYDARAATLTYCCAGHNPPYLLQSGRLTQLSAGGVPVGLLPDFAYCETVHPLETGDLFVIYTDGITEAENLAGEQFGEERLERQILEGAGLTCGEIQVRILDAVREFARGVEQSDDQTIVVGRVL